VPVEHAPCPRRQVSLDSADVQDDGDTDSREDKESIRIRLSKS